MTKLAFVFVLGSLLDDASRSCIKTIIENNFVKCFVKFRRGSPQNVFVLDEDMITDYDVSSLNGADNVEIIVLNASSFTRPSFMIPTKIISIDLTQAIKNDQLYDFVVNICINALNLAILRVNIRGEEHSCVIDPRSKFELLSKIPSDNASVFQSRLIQANGTYIEKLPELSRFERFPLLVLTPSDNNITQGIEVKLSEESELSYFIGKSGDEFILLIQKPNERINLSELIPSATTPILSILGNPKYAIPAKLFEILQLAFNKKDDVDFEILNGLKKLLETLTDHANKLDPQLFPDIAREDSVLIKRMYNKLFREIRDVAKSVDSPKYNALFKECLSKYSIVGLEEEPLSKRPKTTNGATIESLLDKTIFKTLVPFQEAKLPANDIHEDWGPENSLLNVYHRAQLSLIQKNCGYRNYWDYF